MLDDQNWPDIDFGFYRFLNTRKNPQNYIYKLEFSHYVFNYFCSSLVHFLSYLSLKQFTKCIFWRLVLQPAGLIGKDWKQQVDNLEGVQRCCKEPCAMCLCPNNCFDEAVKIISTFKAGVGREGQVVSKAVVLLPCSSTEYVSWPEVIEACSLLDMSLDRF